MLKDPLDYLVVYSLVVVLLGLFGQSLWLAYMVLVPKSAPGQHIEVMVLRHKDYFICMKWNQ
ncbi:hypothetical protein JCM21738_4508 [Mesobacillus boroniphilus JCM 21738]|uniref:Uncharacterized protein n=2 Tax=Mesobacillus boroniphilus TaxID=308892 RepID=W4RUI0_9BACI|nr:hypothetical protein JCM21738_4508 [Mesobacillus boroniphilus JCM 21738]